MEDTLKSLSILSEIEIPLEEYSETPCLVQKKYEMPKNQDEFEKTAINFDQTVPAIK